MTQAVWDREPLRKHLALQGGVTVFTNGCFDLLHVGHLRYLEQARQLGDRLVVGINSDESVRALKGPTRPIVPAAERAEMLAGLRCVDYVMIFEELTASQTLEVLQPEVYVKGGDYDVATLPEAPAVQAYGGVIKLVSFVPGRSTSLLLSRALGTGT